MPFHHAHYNGHFAASDGVTLGGSLVAFVFGTIATAIPEGSTAKAAVIVAAASLVTAIGNQFFQIFRLWIQDRATDRKLKYDHAVLAAQCAGLKDRNEVLEGYSVRDRERIAFLERMVESHERQGDAQQRDIVANRERIAAIEANRANMPLVTPEDNRTG